MEHKQFDFTFVFTLVNHRHNIFLDTYNIEVWNETFEGALNSGFRSATKYMIETHDKSRILSITVSNVGLNND